MHGRILPELAEMMDKNCLNEAASFAERTKVPLPEGPKLAI